MNPKYLKGCIQIIGEHNKQENITVIWDEPIKKVQP
jgi:hypothetical protein